MINKDHFVVDLETLSNGPRAAIVAIGTVFVQNGAIANQQYIRATAESAVQNGGEIDASTVTWWLKQSDLARAEIDGAKESLPLKSALKEHASFMRSCQPRPDDRFVWGNGSSFDNVILREAYKAAGSEAPWPFWNDRDLRTITALYPEAKTLPFEGIKHHALHDALHEAKVLIAALQLQQALQAEAPQP